MKQLFFPLCVATPVPTQSGIRFLHSRTQYDIDNYVDEIWAVLAECNGYQSIDGIVKKLKQFDDEILRGIIEELTSIGVLIESREIALHFHQFSNNPMLYSYNMSHEDVLEYTGRPRLPIFTGEQFSLSEPSTQLSRLQTARKSTRNFNKEQVSLDELSNVLVSTYAPDSAATPSGGGLYPLKLYMIVTQQGTMPMGYYEYDPLNRSLNLYNDSFDKEVVEFALNSDDLLYGAGAVLVIAADLKRHLGKYSNRGYRYTLLEAGHAAQNVQLACAELDLGCLEYGGFQDEVLSKELQLSEIGVTPLIVLALGHKSSDDYEDSQATLQVLRDELVGPKKPVRYVNITGGDQVAKGDSFFAASALHAPNPQQNARRSYEQRFVGGTGSSSNMAQIKAIAEAYERYASGSLRIDLIASTRTLDSRWLDPRKVAPLTVEQLKAYKKLQAFSESAFYEWVRGVSLANAEPVLLPIDLAFFPVFQEDLGRKPLHAGNSSGVAAYSNLEEAQRRALLEAIERDALMHSWFTRVPPVQISHDRLPLHWRRRAEYWQEQGREVYVLDISRHGVSVTQVAIVSREAYPSFVNGASASGNSFEESVAKAFHEAELVLLHMLKSPKTTPIDPERVFNPMDHARLYAHPAHLDNLEWVWSGQQTNVIPKVTQSVKSLYQTLDVVSVRLSPENAPLHVVRVLSEKLVPINFGYGSEYYSHPSLEGRVHPDSLKLPHFFA
ncbi:MAG TPA: YcaO-like family protein [Nitrospira sp.]|nr:YcaO-like family protein [Nitrospira sp.]